jgi:hypothetical protein
MKKLREGGTAGNSRVFRRAKSGAKFVDNETDRTDVAMLP